VTEIEQKALVLLNKVQDEQGYVQGSRLYRRDRNVFSEALCRAIEQREAIKQELSDFRQEVSDVVYRALTSIAKGCAADAAGDLSRFVIPKPKPDPLVEVLDAMKDGRAGPTTESYAKCLRAALDTLGFEIREKNDDQ
jgi:hypothetical protein